MAFVFEKIDAERARALANSVNLPLVSGGNQSLIDRELEIELYSLGGGGSFPQRGDDPPSLWCFTFSGETIGLATRTDIQRECDKNVAFIRFELFSIPSSWEHKRQEIHVCLQNAFSSYLSNVYRTKISAQLVFPISKSRG